MSISKQIHFASGALFVAAILCLTGCGYSDLSTSNDGPDPGVDAEMAAEDGETMIAELPVGLHRRH